MILRIIRNHNFYFRLQSQTPLNQRSQTPPKTERTIQAVDLAQQILNETPDNDAFLRQLNVVEALLANKFPQLSPQEIIKMLNLKTTDLKQTRFYQEL